MDNEIINELISNLSEIKRIEYNKTNFKPTNKIVIIKKKKNHNKETIDLKNFKSKVSSTVYKYSQKNLNNKDNNIINFGNDLNDSNNNIFNLVDNNTIQITWRQLTNDEKIEKIKRFFSEENKKHLEITNQNKYSQELIDKMIDLITKNKIIYKKQVNYDQINNRIISLPCIKYEEKENCYKYHVEQKKKKKKSAKQMFK